jgi:ubiquitin C-terminal hydrolase
MRVPPGYDSYEWTGMVGLENLGATCYLNALLQVSA